MNIQRLHVGLSLGGKDYEVGELVRDNIDIHFKYYPEFLDSGLNISPIRFPFDNNVKTGDPKIFDGLPGVFNDSLPDGWGRLLLDRMLIARGENPVQIHPMDRLAYVGDGGPGALIYEPSLNNERYETYKIELDKFADEMRSILKGSGSDMIEELYELGGSSGGARPKIQVGYHEETDHMIVGFEDLPQGYEHWIIKFPSSSDRVDAGCIEYAYHLMALEAGIEMEECKLFIGASGREYFGTRRFDRVGNSRLHMLSASGMMHDDFRYSQMDYGHLMDCGFQLERHVDAYEKVLRLAAFNVYAHNRDDHSKNFSFLMDGKGDWRFSPAYDLTFSSSALGIQSTMVAGESQNPGKDQLLELARIFSVGKAGEILDQVRSSISRWSEFAETAGVTTASKRVIDKTLNNV